MITAFDWVRRVAAILLLAVGLTALLSPRNSWFVLPVGWVWGVTVLLLVGWWLAEGRRAPQVQESTSSLRTVWLGALAAGLLVVAHQPLALIDFGWDARQVVWAVEKVVSGEGPSSGTLDYFSKYPNNRPVVLLGVAAATVGGWFGLGVLTSLLLAQALAVVVMVWCLGAALVLLGRPRAVLPVQVLATILVGLNPQMSIYYSDVPSAGLVALSLWAGVRASVSRRPAWWVLSLAALVCAAALKPYAVALAVGALVLLPVLTRRRSARAAYATAAVAALALGVGVPAVHAVSGAATALTTERLERVQEPYPVEHFLAMGTYDSGEDSPTRVYGGWNWEHASAMKHEPDPEVRRSVSRQKIVAQVSERGLVGNISFTARKVAWTWGDGTFWAHGEGDDKDKEAALDLPVGGTAVQQWFIGSGEGYRAVTAGLVQGVWVGLLLVTGWCLRRSRTSPWIATCATTLLVLTAYLALFESRPRYLVALLPVLLLLAGLVAFRGPRGSAESGQSGNTPLPSAQ